MHLTYQPITTMPTAAQRGLLLTADPQWSHVEALWREGTALAVHRAERLVGIVLLVPRPAQTLEIANLAVDQAVQRQGVAQQILADVRQLAERRGDRWLMVATGTTSLTQLYLYQKCGYRVVAVEPNYFTDHYAQPIIENGLRLVDRLVLRRAVMSAPPTE